MNFYKMLSFVALIILVGFCFVLFCIFLYFFFAAGLSVGLNLIFS